MTIIGRREVRGFIKFLNSFKFLDIESEELYVQPTRLDGCYAGVLIVGSFTVFGLFVVILDSLSCLYIIQLFYNAIVH